MPRTLKSSDIFWAGQLPRSWKFCRAKYIFVQKNERGNKHNLELLSPTQKFGVIPQTLYEKLTGMTPVKLKKNINLSTLKTIHKGGFCISLRSFQGGFEYSDYEGVISPAYQVFYPAIDIVARYYKYLFKDKSFIEKMNSYAMSLRDGKNIAFEDFGNTRIPLPPLDEQKKIADFLDKQCGEVDALAHNIQQQIDTLEQYKRAIITETVTKGLNPSAPMKDSSIPWIGQIPADWAIHPLYYYFGERNRPNRLGKNKNLLSLSYGKIIKKDINTNEGLLPASYNSYNIIEPLDIVLRLTDLQNDKRSLRTGLSFERGIITSAYVTLKPVKQVSSVFFHYLLHAYDVSKVLYNMGNGVRQSLNYDELSKLPLIEPPLAEQKKIADFLDDKCGKIDAMIKTKQEQLAKLEEYKKAIIFEYVTGKKPVPEEER